MKTISAVYLAGKITNNPNYKIDFERSEAQVKKLFPEAEVFNPVTLCEKKGIWEWDECMTYTHLFLMKADTIALIGGWTESKGARWELSYAIEENKRIIELEADEYRRAINEVKAILNNVRDCIG